MRSSHAARRCGLTIVELLVAGVVLVVVLGAAGVFFALQVQLQRDVQARNEVQDRVRVVLQLVTQDLALAGNTIRMTEAGAIDPGTGFDGCFPDLLSAGEACLQLTNGSATSSTLRMRYVSSQFPVAESCREVGYRLDGTVLRRSDLACGVVPDDDEDPWIDLAPSVLGFKVIVVCSNSNRFDTFPAAGCGGKASYARSAIISVAAESISNVRSAAVAGAMTLVTTTSGSTTPVACEAGRICFDGTQEVLMPNLKDQ